MSDVCVIKECMYALECTVEENNGTFTTTVVEKNVKNIIFGGVLSPIL